jgi:hypothetical protein
MINKKGVLFACALLAAPLTAPAAASAAVVIYSGYDSAATGPSDKPNSDAARARFLKAISGLPDVFTNAFETGATGLVATSYDLGAGATLASTSPSGHPLTIRTTPACGFNICGGNTTTGGANFAYMMSGEVVFDFAQPIQAFGAFFNGVQFSNLKLAFNDGSVQYVPVPGQLGAAFVGFTDFDHDITQIRFSAPQDFVAIDDVTFAWNTTSGAVPEPAVWALMIGGFGLAGSALRARRRAAAAA